MWIQLQSSKETHALLFEILCCSVTEPSEGKKRVLCLFSSLPTFERCRRLRRAQLWIWRLSFKCCSRTTLHFLCHSPLLQVFSFPAITEAGPNWLTFYMKTQFIGKYWTRGWLCSSGPGPRACCTFWRCLSGCLIARCLEMRPAWRLLLSDSITCSSHPKISSTCSSSTIFLVPFSIPSLFLPGWWQLSCV